MTEHSPTSGSGQPDAAEVAGKAAAAVAGLAREVEALRTRLEPLVETPARVDALARLIAQLADTVTALTGRADVVAPPSWLMLPTDPAAARELLDALTAWMARVYLRYPDAAEQLPECWCWHPEVVEELVWLMHAWLAAFQGKHASVQLVADWHDRQRPGVVRRIGRVAGACSRENHQTRHGRTPLRGHAPVVPALDALDEIADWWGSAREQPAPEPADNAATVTAAEIARGPGVRGGVGGRRDRWTVAGT